MSLTSHLVERYQLKLKSLTLVPSYGGVFNVSVNGEQVYTNRDTGRFPTDQDIDAAIDARLAGGTAP